MTSRNRALIVGVVLLTTAAVSARGETGPYIGASVGQTSVELDLVNIGSADFRIDDEDFAFKVFFGYELPGPLAVEVGFRDLGEVTGNSPIATLRSESNGVDGFALGKLPLGPVALFAKAGVIVWDTELESRAAQGSGIPDIRVSDDGTAFAWGVGASVEVGKFGVRGEFEKLEVDLPDSVTMLSVGVTLEF